MIVQCREQSSGGGGCVVRTSSVAHVADVFAWRQSELPAKKSLHIPTPGISIACCHFVVKFLGAERYRGRFVAVPLL